MEKIANKKSGSIILGSLIFVVTILLLSVTTYESTAYLVTSYIDVTSLLMLVALEIASIIITGVSGMNNIVKIVRKTVLPIGFMMSVFKLVGLFAGITLTNNLFTEISLSILPLLYAIGIFVLALLAEIRNNANVEE